MDLHVVIVAGNSVGLSVLETYVLQLREIFLHYFIVNSSSYPLLKIIFFLEQPLVIYGTPLNKFFIVLIFFSYFLPLFY